MDFQARNAKQKWLRRQFQTSGVQLEPAALHRLVEVIDHVQSPEALIQLILDEIESGLGERRVTLDLLEKLIVGVEGITGGASTSGGDMIQVVDALHTPYILYDPIRKLFRRSTEPRHLHGDVKSKLQLYVDRFLLVQQRIKRNKLFRPPQWTSIGGRSTGGDTSELTELKALLGLVGERRCVLGFLTRQDEGRYFIEDMSTRLPLDLTGTETADGLFTENCIVVAEGFLTSSGAFRAIALGLPPAEPRADSLAAMQGLDFFGAGPVDARQEDRWRTEHAEDRVVILSDVWLNRPDIMEKLQLIFSGYSAMETPPSVFVLMGNFQSYDANAANSHFARLKENFAALGRLINQYPSIRSRSKFLIVPGPGDIGPGSLLPRPPLPKSIAGPLVEAVPNAMLCSNPCRIRHGAADLVLFRGEMQHKMRGLSLLPNAGKEALLFEQLCATVLQEAHLVPLPLEYQPIIWEHDHALSLYPMPHALVLADSEASNMHSFDICSCVNPGSLSNGTFAAWNPVTNEAELCDALPPSLSDLEEDEEMADDAGPDEGNHDA